MLEAKEGNSETQQYDSTTKISYFDAFIDFPTDFV